MLYYNRKKSIFIGVYENFNKKPAGLLTAVPTNAPLRHPVYHFGRTARHL